MFRQFPKSTLSLIFPGGAALIALLAFASAAFGGQVHARAATPSTVVAVTEGTPSELVFTLSKSSVTWPAKATADLVTFRVTNKGSLSHTFKVCTTPATSTAANRCTGVSTKPIKPGQTISLTVTFKKRGKFEYLSTAPGDAASGMKGLIGVGAKVTTPHAGSGSTSATGAGKTSSGSTTTPATNLTGNPTAGAAVFQSAGCGSCHTLAAAGSTGAVGPNLDSLKPSAALVKSTVTSGFGEMPSFTGTLTAQQIADVAAYVATSTGG